MSSLRDSSASPVSAGRSGAEEERVFLGWTRPWSLLFADWLAAEPEKLRRRLVVVPLAASDEARQAAAYPELGLAVDHLRVESLDPAALPAWQRAGVEAGEA